MSLTGAQRIPSFGTASRIMASAKGVSLIPSTYHISRIADIEHADEHGRSDVDEQEPWRVEGGGGSRSANLWNHLRWRKQLIAWHIGVRLFVKAKHNKIMRE